MQQKGEEMNTLDLLLKTKVQFPEKQVKMKRLSENTGEDIVFTIQAIPLDRLEELREANGKSIDFQTMVVLNGVKEPNLKAPELKEHFRAHTPIETVKNMLLAGEIEELYLKISTLSGYGPDTIEEIEKK